MHPDSLTPMFRNPLTNSHKEYHRKNYFHSIPFSQDDGNLSEEWFITSLVPNHPVSLYHQNEPH